MIKRFGILTLMVVCASLMLAQSPLWMRYPAISPDGKSVAFSYKGDIFVVPANGGKAINLTNSNSYEKSPVWSPDSKTIAYSSNYYGGNIDVFTISAKGGEATRVTMHSATETPYAFSKDGKYIYYSAQIADPASSALFPTGVLFELYKKPIKGGRSEQVLAFPAENISFHPTANKFLYQDKKGFENSWRKHHTSSVTRDILEYDLDKKTYKPIITTAGEDTNPVYSTDGKSLYFLSERGGTFNVFSATLAQSDKVKKITNFKSQPVRFLSISKTGTLCFGYDGEIYTMEQGKSPKKLAVEIEENAYKPRLEKKLFSRGANSAANSADGKQVAFTVRGDVFVTSTDYSTTKQITKTDAAEAEVDFAPDNRTVAYSSYRDGYWNIFTAKIKNDNEPNFPNCTEIIENQLIKNDKSEKQNPKYSPDGKEIAFVKDRLKLVVYNFATKKVREITDGSFQHETTGEMNYSWSPDGKWFAIEYVAKNHAPYSDIGVISAKGGEKITNITNSGYFDTNPRWVMNGDAIIFSTDRYGMRNHASWGSMRDEMIFFTNRKAYNIFNMSKEEYELYKEQEKEAKKAAEKEKKESKDKKDSKDKKESEKEKEAAKDIKMELDNLEERIVRLTPNSSELGDAYVDKDGKTLYYLTSFEGAYDLWTMDLRKKDAKLANKLGIYSGSFSPDKKEKNLFLLGSSTMQKMDMGSKKFTPITYRAEMKIDGYKEREAMFNFVKSEEGKRFYQKSMHGVNWEKLTNHYRKYLPYIDNNFDFSEMLSELLGELNVSHTGSGYRPATSAEQTAELGLLLSNNDKGDGVIVDEILLDGPFDSFLSKLKKGDIIEKIDGTQITKDMNYYQLLEGKRGKNTLITIKSATDGHVWNEVIKPISSSYQNEILYKRWVKQRAAEVDRLSNGKLGYVHIRSMGDGSFREVYSDALGKYYDRKGIVIDIRYNGGGRLHEDVEVFFSGKQYLMQEIRGKDYCEMPSRRWNKPSIMLITEADYSNAHGTPWVYKTMGIGKLVGMPVPGTMTSVNWVTLQDPSVYFGIPVIGYRTAEGTYLENTQLEPDIKAPLDLTKAVKGEDTQIEAAVKELLKEIEK